MKYGILIILLLPMLASAKVYQCTNDKGEVNFSNLPCPATEEKKALEFTDAQGAIEADPEKGKSYFDDLNAGPMCVNAVENSHYSLDKMLSIGKRNYAGGYIEKAEYDKSLEAITEIKKRLTTSTCENSTGKDRAFFECMESGYTFIVSCVDETKPPLLLSDSLD